jgi:hypothetical protein
MKITSDFFQKFGKPKNELKKGLPENFILS